MNKLTKEQKDYQKACKNLLKAQQKQNDTLRLMQSSCNHDIVYCAYENNDFDDCFEYRVCVDCGFHEEDKNELVGFKSLKRSNNKVSVSDFYQYVNRFIL